MEARGGGGAPGVASVKAEPSWEAAAHEGRDQLFSELARQGNIAEVAERLQAGGVQVKVEAVDVKQEPADLPDKLPRVPQSQDLVITELMCVTVEAEFVPGEGEGRRETAGACESETAHPAERDQGPAPESPEVRVKVEAVDTEDLLETEQAVARHTPGHVAAARSPGVRVKVEAVETEQAVGEPRAPEFVKVEAMDPEHVLEEELVKGERHSPEPSLPARAAGAAAGAEGAPCPAGARAGTHTCDVCAKTFKASCLLIQHMRTHTGEKPYPCEYCGMRFTTFGNLNRHERVHTGEKPYSCRICGKQFSAWNSIKRHERLHTGERPYSCEICHRDFNSLSNLKSHARIHTGEKPYSCEVCGQKYKQLHSLKEHRRTHTGERPFSCGMCNKGFAAAGSLRRHERLHARTTSSV